MNSERKTPLLCMKVGVTSALYNGQRVKLDTAPVRQDGKILIPTDALAKAGIACEDKYVALEDVKALKEMDMFGAIVGKAIYTSAIDLSEAIKITED